jgi:phosphohistidine phosphatase
MKTLTLLRHAKSCWSDTSLNDFERPLNKRGKRDAPFIAKKLVEQDFSPQVILASPAKRARITTTFVAQELNFPLQKITWDKSIYVLGMDYLVKLIQKQHSEYEHILLVGHNFELTDFANFLCVKEVENIPTMGVYSMNMEIDSWSEVGNKCAELAFFEYPKLYK